MSRRHRIERAASRWSIRGLAAAVAFAFMAPIYWMFISAFKTEQEILRSPPRFVAFRPTLENFRTIFGRPEDTPVLQWFGNSAVIALAFATLATAIYALAAFPLARMEFRGRRLYTGLLLCSLVIPHMVLLIPNYVLVDSLRWTDTYAAVILPGLGGTFSVLLLRQYFLSLPMDLEEAALMDGAGALQVLRHVVAPLSKSPLVTVFVMNFMASWNDYFWPLITLYSPGMRTMPVGMATLQGRYIHFYGKMMAGALLIAIPSMVLFILVQRYYVRSIAQAGLKT